MCIVYWGKLSQYINQQCVYENILCKNASSFKYVYCKLLHPNKSRILFNSMMCVSICRKAFHTDHDLNTDVLSFQNVFVLLGSFVSNAGIF